MNRQNKTVRPDTHIPENEQSLSTQMLYSVAVLVLTGPVAMEVIRNNMAARTTDLRLYLDVVPDPGKVCNDWISL